MSHIRLLVVKVDDDNPDTMTELASFEMPEAPLDTLTAETALDDLEASTFEIGTEALKRVLQARWEQIDQQLADKARQSFSPSLPQSRRTPNR